MATLTQEQATKKLNEAGFSNEALATLKGAMATPTPTVTPAPTALQNPVPATALKATPTFAPPIQTASTAQELQQGSIANSVATARKQVDTVIAEQKATIDKELETLKASRADTLAKAKPLNEPFRQELAKKESERLAIEENFQANQKLTNELDALLQQGNDMIARKNGVSMNSRASAIRTQRTIEDVQARAGVIEAVMKARNNQITVAQNMIDRSVQAIVADRTDSLNYYNTLLELDNKDILRLDDQSKKIAEQQVALVQGDLDKAEKTAEYIKELMINPETASFMADAGVSLTDSVETIQEKMAKQAQVQEARDAKNKLVEAGYEILAYNATGSMPIEVGGQILYARPRAGSALALDLESKRATINRTNALATQRSGSGVGGGTYATDMDALVGTVLSAIPSKFGQQQFQAQIAKARNDADKLNIVASQILKAQPAEVKRDFANQAVGLQEIDKAIKLLDTGVQTGAINNALQYTFNIVGKDFDPKLAQINSYLVSAIQPYRNSVTGAAWGTQEDGEYQALFGSTKYSPKELKQRLESVKETLKTKSATTLNAYANPMGYGSNVFETGAYTPSSQTTTATPQGALFDSVMGTQEKSAGGYWDNLKNSAGSFFSSLFGQ